MHTKEFIRLGNCTIGSMSIAFPFARLKMNDERIEIKTIVGTYELESFQTCQILPVRFLGMNGIKILHRKISYPTKIIFYYLGSRDKFWNQMGLSAFPLRRSELSVVVRSKAMALRSSFLAVSTLSLMSLFVFGGKSIFLSGTLFWVFALHSLIPVQKIGLKKNRHIDEIRHWLRFFILICFILLLVT